MGKKDALRVRACLVFVCPWYNDELPSMSIRCIPRLVSCRDRSLQFPPGVMTDIECEGIQCSSDTGTLINLQMHRLTFTDAHTSVALT